MPNCIVLKALRDGDIVLDVGANIGTYALRCARAVGPTGKVLALEPQASLAARLCKSARLSELENICVIEAAAADRKGEANLHRPKSGQKGSATRHRQCLNLANIAASPEYSSASVSTVTLDGLCSELGIGRVDFVKVDVAGAEMEALRGAERILTDCRPRLMIEYSNIALRAREYTAADLLGLLRDVRDRVLRRHRFTKRLRPVDSVENLLDVELCNLHCLPS